MKIKTRTCEKKKKKKASKKENLKNGEGKIGVKIF